MPYWLCRFLSYFICRVFGRMEVIGRENIPHTGGVLLCSNHVSYIDPPALGSGCPRPVHFMAKLELFQTPVLGYLITSLGAFPVKRGTPDRGAIRKAVELLQGGEIVVMFPEGTRSTDGQLHDPEPGAGLIALRGGVPVIPVALINTQKLLPPHSVFFHFTRVKVIYGEPVQLDDLQGQSGREAIEETGKRIMAAIGELLEKQRG